MRDAKVNRTWGRNFSESRRRRDGRGVANGGERPYKNPMSGFRARSSGGLGEKKRRRAGVVPRAAADADRPAIDSLLEASSLPLTERGENLEHFFVHEGESGSVIGVAGLELYGRAGLLRSVVVAGPARRQGIAAALIEQIVARARTQGCTALYLLTLDTEMYFRRFGFEVISRSEAPAAIRGAKEFALLCPESAVLMQKKLVA